MRHKASAGARALALTAFVALIALGVAACGTTSSSSSSTSSSSESGTIGLLLPETKTTRYEQFDHPYIEQDLKKLCPDCKFLYANADQDADQQQSQAESMLTQGVDVMILDPVDGKAAEAIVNKAQGQGVPVVSYDRLANGPVSDYVGFDTKQVGELQGKALLSALKANGTEKSGDVVMINGAPTDPNAAGFKAGAHSALDGNVTIGKEFDTPDWSADKAQSEMESAIATLGKDKIVGVYSANDGMAAGIAAALNSAGYNPFPPLTGQDAQVDGIQRILAGQQAMTIYKPIAPEAQIAAQMAIGLLHGQDYKTTETTNNGTADVPSKILTPIAVTVKNINDTVVKDGFLTVKEICTPQYAADCKKAGLQ